MNKPPKTIPRYLQQQMTASGHDSKAPEPPPRRATVTQFHAEVMSGPLPSAEELARYEDVLPGMAERLLAIHERGFSLQEQQAKHRFGIEKVVIHGDSIRSYTGLLLGFIVAMSLLVGAYKLGMAGHDWLAGTTATMDVGAFVGVFVYGSNSRRSERSERNKLLNSEQKRHDSESQESVQPRLPGI